MLMTVAGDDILDELYRDPRRLCAQLMSDDLQDDTLTSLDMFLDYNSPRQSLIMDMSVRTLFLIVACVFWFVL